MYALKTHPLVEEDLKAFDNSVVVLILKKLVALQLSSSRATSW